MFDTQTCAVRPKTFMPISSLRLRALAHLSSPHVSGAPARAAGLHDRGEIRVGLRADLIHARTHGTLPVIQQVWRQAKRVF